ncbi:hypothetical protein EYF80_035054 [Liparis tanakae]|uniref:Uncharacterized protein n=1 Tax=Liparis tanakae TaxID=230148 RepID=A0A4Z2GN77_9TELE|nr:hypothetical protein EYF80_035054 [Liparis tanakae]
MERVMLELELRQHGEQQVAVDVVELQDEVEDVFGQIADGRTRLTNTVSNSSCDTVSPSQMMELIRSTICMCTFWLWPLLRKQGRKARVCCSLKEENNNTDRLLINMNKQKRVQQQVEAREYGEASDYGKDMVDYRKVRDYGGL